MRLALGIRYDGSRYCGWQVQPDQMTVQSELEAALAAFTASGPVHTVCAGRTDTGVHALNQVVHIDAEVNRAMASWVRGVNSFLPPSVAVRWAKIVPESFSARFSALSRTYEYWILNDAVRDPLLASRAAWCFRPLDIDLMRRAASFLIGEHDFTSFRAAECQAKSPVRHVYSIDIIRRGRLVGLRIRANAFLQHMVRNIVGELVYAGTGREKPERTLEVLNLRNRAAAAPTYAACGLCLVEVEYPPEFGIEGSGIAVFGSLGS